MGLFDMLKHLTDTIHEIGGANEIFDEIGEKLKAAHEAGKLDDNIWSGFQAFDAKYKAGGDGENDAEKAKGNMESLIGFSKLLTDNVDKLPEDVKPALEKLKDLSNLVEKAKDKF